MAREHNRQKVIIKGSNVYFFFTLAAPKTKTESQRMRQITTTILLFAATIIGTGLQAQQEPQFTQNMFNKVFTNPGFAGIGEGICVTGLGRQQWASFKDSEGNRVAPETFLISIDAPVRVLRGGLSALVMQDKIGFTKTITLRLGYNYIREMGYGKLGVGAHVGFNNRSIDFGKFIAVDPNDQLLQQLTGEESEILIDASLGVVYEVPDLYFIGFSVNQVLQTRGQELANWTTNVDSTTSGSFLYRMTLDRTFYLQGGYEYVFRNSPDFALLPYAMVKLDQAAVQLDVAALLEYKNMFWGGLNYRIQDAVSVIVGLQYKNFKIGYSYDITTSKLGLGRTAGSHEVMLKYCFKIEAEKGRKSYRNTRFL
jgi:type IX secretion system PorP/SprF family membrane protein